MNNKKLPQNAELHQLMEMQEQLILKAWSDPVFKAELTSDPAKAIEKVFGIKVPSFIKLKVLEETPDTRFITIPYKAQDEDSQLKDEELENISGGGSRSYKNRTFFCTIGQ